MVQLAVSERAIEASTRGEVEEPGHALEAMVKRFMVYGTRSPFCWVCRIKGFAHSIAETTTSLGEIEWRENGELVLYREAKFTMTQLRQLVRSELDETFERLAKIMLVDRSDDATFRKTVPRLRIHSLVDDPSEGAPGFSFLSHPANKQLHGHEGWLLDRVVATRSLRHRFLVSAEPMRWRHDTVIEYLGDVDRFLTSLLLLIHMLGGQPARGTEIASVLFENPSASGLAGRRNIFIDDGLVNVVTFYHKSLKITGSPKIIHRYLPRELSEVVVYYL